MKKITFSFFILFVFGLFYTNLASAKPPSGYYHTHDERECYVNVMGVHKPVIYDRIFLVKLIKHDKKTIKQAQDIMERAYRNELKTVAQDIIKSHTEEKERLEPLLKEWYNE